MTIHWQSQSTCDGDYVGALEPCTIALADVVAALSYALDITEGQPEGHATKSCLIAMRIAEEIGLPPAVRSALFYGTLLKDAGCSSNAAKVCSLFGADDIAIKHSFKVHDLSNKLNAIRYMIRRVAPNETPLVRAAKLFALLRQPNAGKELIETRCSRGADIVRKLGFDDEAAAAVRALDEHWDGTGEPFGLARDEIPLLGRIACLSQTFEVYFSSFGLVAALDVAKQRAGKWFDPELVRSLLSLRSDHEFWSTLDHNDSREALSKWEPEDQRMFVDEARLDAIAEGFADVIDAKSPWTCRHSFGVADAMVGILEQQNYGAAEIRYWRRAALLHDIGKLGVSNLILDKPGRLTTEEFDQMKRHVDHTRRILHLVPCFSRFADDAAAHHERLDGTGYRLGLYSHQLSAEAKALAVADCFDALSAKRPYRDRTLSLEEVFDIMQAEAESRLCRDSFEALRRHIDTAKT